MTWEPKHESYLNEWIEIPIRTQLLGGQRDEAKGKDSRDVINVASAIVFLRIGAHGMTAMCSLLFADLPPFVMCQGQPAAARSMNFEGLRRRGFSPERIAAVKAMHKALYREELTLEQAKERIGALSDSHPEAQPDVDMMLGFLDTAHAQRGIVR